MLSEVKSNFPQEINVELRHENLQEHSAESNMPNEIHQQFSQNGENSQFNMARNYIYEHFQIKRVVSGENDFESKINTH